jgi:hypothetical protein
MPDAVDTIAVPRDISAIAQRAGVMIDRIIYKGPIQEKGIMPGESDVMQSSITSPEAHLFVVSFEGSYNQLKEMLSLMESNAYPLEVHALNVTEGDGGFLVIDMEVVTYDRITPSATSPALQ